MNETHNYLDYLFYTYLAKYWKKTEFPDWAIWENKEENYKNIKSEIDFLCIVLPEEKVEKYKFKVYKIYYE